MKVVIIYLLAQVYIFSAWNFQENFLIIQVLKYKDWVFLNLLGKSDVFESIQSNQSAKYNLLFANTSVPIYRIQDSMKLFRFYSTGLIVLRNFPLKNRFWCDLILITYTTMTSETMIFINILCHWSTLCLFSSPICNSICTNSFLFWKLLSKPTQWTLNFELNVA